MARDRRSFLKTAGMAAVVTSAAPLGLSLQGRAPGGSTPEVLAAPPARPASPGRFALELEGEVVCFLNSYSGGFPFGKVAELQDGSGGLPDKLIASVGYEDIVIEFGATAGTPLFGWVAAMVSGDGTPRSGAIVFTDAKSEATARLEFLNALIAEVVFPAADAASKEPAFFRLVIAPERTEYVPASGKVVAPIGKKQKQWLASAFRLTVGDLPTQRVSKVEALTVKQQIADVSPGGGNAVVRVPGKIEYPNLVPTFSEVDAAPWFAYFDQFVLQGNGAEKSGKLEYLAPDGSVLFGVEFQNVGIFKCSPSRNEDGGEIARVTAELYMEHLSFQAGLAQ